MVFNMIMEALPVIPLPGMLERYRLVSFLHYDLSTYLGLIALILGAFLVFRPERQKIHGTLRVDTKLIGFIASILGSWVALLGFVAAIFVISAIVFVETMFYLDRRTQY